MSAQKSLFIIFFILLLVLLTFVFFPENSYCKLDDLVIGQDMIPNGWDKGWTYLPPALPREGAVDAISLNMESKSFTAHHTLYRYRNSIIAAIYYVINDAVFFPQNYQNGATLVDTSEWNLGSDSQIIKCSQVEPIIGKRCSAVLRYGPYISNISFSIEDGVMSLQDFKDITVLADRKFNICIKK